VGIWQSFKNYRVSRRVKREDKYLKVIKNSKAIKDDRAIALEHFRHHKDPAVAVPALLQRFEYSLEHGINDTREKETARDGILQHGDKALPYVQEYLKKSNRIAWPIKILQQLGSEAQVIEILKSVLNFEDVSFDQGAVDKNYDILCYLADYKLPGYTNTLAHFLKDPDERVRFACVEVLFMQDDPEVKTLLEPFLADDTSENRRLRMKVIDAFVKNNWRIEDEQKIAAGLLTEGVYVTKKGKIEKRN
jgi:hypothetical protein